MYTIKVYSNTLVGLNNDEGDIGNYELYSHALEKMLRVAKHCEEYMKRKYQKIFSYYWEDNYLIREEYGGKYEDNYIKFEIKES